MRRLPDHPRPQTVRCFASGPPAAPCGPPRRCGARAASAPTPAPPVSPGPSGILTVAVPPTRRRPLPLQFSSTAASRCRHHRCRDPDHQQSPSAPHHHGPTISSAPPSPLRLLLPPASRRRRHHFRPQGTPSTLGLERIYSVHASRPSPARPAWRPRSGASGGHTSSPPHSRSSGLGSHARFPPLLLPSLRRTSSFLRPSSPVPCLPPARASSSLRIRSRDATLLCLTASTSLRRFCRALRRPPARPPARPGSSVLRVR